MEFFFLFGTSFLAATFLPFSSEVHVAALIYSKKSYLLIFLVASIGNTLGGVFNYYIGLYAKLEWASKYLKISKKQIDKFQSRINNYGSLLALLCWMPIIGDPLSLALGYFKVPLRKVLGLMFLGKALRYLVIIYLLI